MKDNRFISLGGNGNHTNEVTELTFETFHRLTTKYQFNRLSNLFPSRYGFSVVEYNNYLYIFGGKNISSQENGAVVNELYSFNLSLI
jgi:hypothetical protein